MILKEFYIIPSDSKDPNDWYSSEALKSHIIRLIDRVQSMTDPLATIDPDRIAALVVRRLWAELPSAVPTQEQLRTLNSRQKLIRNHWVVFVQWAIYQEVDCYDKSLSKSRRIELTRSNLFLHAGKIAEEPPETFLEKYRTNNTSSDIHWYRDLKTFVRGKVKWKIRDIICKLDGCKTFGSTDPAILTAIQTTSTDDDIPELAEQALDVNNTPRLVRQALIEYGYKSIDGEWQGTDVRRLLILYQVFREVYDGNTLGKDGKMLLINRWGDREFQLVTDRYQQLAADLPPYQNPELSCKTTKGKIEFLGYCVRCYRDPLSISMNTPISNEEGDGNSELGDFLEAPIEQSSAEGLAINTLISEFLDNIDNLDTGILLFKYVSIDPNQNISPELKKISLSRKIYPSDKKVGDAICVDQATVYRRLKKIFTKLRDRLFNELGESKDINTLRIVLGEISVYYVELLEGYLAKAVELLPATDTQVFQAIYNDRQQIDQVDRHRIHRFLIDRVSEQILERIRHSKMMEFSPEGQAIEAIDNWIQSQLSQRI
jgi:hypothetical protein